MTSRGGREAGEGAGVPMARTRVAVLLLVLVTLAAGCTTVHPAGHPGHRTPPGSGRALGLPPPETS
jgi:hypothetical protein